MAANSNKIKQLTAQRDTDIHRLTELKHIAERALTDRDIHSHFKMRFKHLELVFNDFEKQHNAILAILSTVEDYDLSEQTQIRADFDNDYFHVQAIYSQIFENDSLNNSASLEESQRHSRVKLPKIEVPKFDGDLKQWQTFSDMFESLVHNDDSLTNIEKFNYLIHSLKDSPLALVKCTPMTGENYLIAYNALKQRYQNKRLVATSHWREIENCKKIVSVDNSQTLRHLVNTFVENVAALENMQFPVKHWNFILVHMLLDRLDSDTATRFELSFDSDSEIPSFENLIKFLNKQCVALDTVASQTKTIVLHSKNKVSQFAGKNLLSSKQKPSSTFFVKTNPNKISCSICNGDHQIYKCTEFLSKTPQERFNVARSNHWCTNCLGSRHNIAQCRSTSLCRKCVKKHHTLLHFDFPTRVTNSTLPAETLQNISSSQSTIESPTVNLLSRIQTTVLLSTAIIDIRDSSGKYRPIRALLDSASQCSFISSNCCNKLGLTRKNLSLDIRGVGQSLSQAKQSVSSTIKPKGNSEPIISLDFVVLPQICSDMPCTNIPIDKFSKFVNLKLADPYFNISRPVDVLLGADIFAFVMKGGSSSTSFNEPIALDTIFGWIIMGKVNLPSSITSSSFLTSVDYSVETVVQKFWELEQVPFSVSRSPDDTLAESLYESSVTRLASGRYCVSLPFKSIEPQFVNSRYIAHRNFLSLERRLLKCPALYKQYRDFMQDYLDSNHMDAVPNTTVNSHHTYYIPHHCVLKPESSTTKLRVVFNASSKDTNNLSLNDTLLTGPKLQSDIVSLLFKFRLHPVVFTADIKQMYRQILITDKHRDYQRILWRFSPSDSITEYRLNTVTFGISSSPYLAIKTLLQLCKDEQRRFPLAAVALAECTYVDDILAGASSIEEALCLQRQLIDLLQSGGFELRKWTSNSSDLLAHLPESYLEINPLSLDLETDTTVKILGLQWLPVLDVFTYRINLTNKPLTKRTMLSDLARMFDPLGFITPITIYCKIMIQHLWSVGLDWDSPLPDDISSLWENYKSELQLLSSLQIPRRTITDKFLTCEIHGFADASEKAYAAVVYLRISHSPCNIQTFFVCAKSKVAPLKRISIPRLELCAALLLSNLIHYVQETYKKYMCFTDTFAWSDSSVVLSWIRSSPHRWKTFVSNRVSTIQDKLPAACWHHVASLDNPADCASRGLTPSEFLNNTLWWAGPTWLTLPNEQWPKNLLDNSNILPESLEEEKINSLATYVNLNALDSLLDRFSSLSKITRIISYCHRFIYNCRNSTNRKTNPFTIYEINQGLFTLIKHVQYSIFYKEMKNMKRNRLVSKWLRKLSPFIDDDGVLRVGGRLVNSKLSYHSKHPAILPRKHRLTHLIIEKTHKEYLHPGVQTLHFLLSQNYWILSPKRAIRSVISSCHKCFKLNPKFSPPIMGNLPFPRITQLKPFSHVGIDFGGPFLITLTKTRGSKSQKAYICLFVCLTVKAIHVELCSDLSTDAFLAALRRFISRRGRIACIYSDNATNFHGANRQLLNNMRDASAEEAIEWRFNPPSAPHFGGIYEAGIKSVKSHLKRIVGDQILTYEEFNTVLVQIEAVLNSRPLCAVSLDPNDISALTPGHFLTLEPLTCLPEPELTELKLGRLTRWQLLQRMHQDFWGRWKREYLHTLIQRSKWIDPTVPIVPGTIVILKDDLLPVLSWPLARIIEVHPGHDGITRVVTVKTQKGIFKRPVTKIAPLPPPEL